MCEELKLIQTHIGVWNLKDLTSKQCVVQLRGIEGVYCIKNLVNNKILIGEGIIYKRIRRHINNESNNRLWQKDIQKYGPDNFRLIWIIPEEDEIQRKLIENKLQLYFAESCYNRPRRQYPTQKELIEHVDSKRNVNGLGKGNVVQRLQNYTKIQRNYIDECWEFNNVGNDYGSLRYKNRIYLAHVLIYILHYGDICGISSVVHHKCENKRCVNPEHLFLTTNKGNILLYTNTVENKLKSIEYSISSKYKGVNLDKGYYRASIFIDDKQINLGLYSLEIEAAQNRDYYLVKNNLLDKKGGKLNFFNIDYGNFTPYPQRGGKISNYLTS